VAEMGYRLDLSDFAVAYMRHRTRATVHFGIVAEAIMNAVPRLLVPTKNLGGQYEKLFADMGWPVVDYTDTLFSSGALVADWLGFLLWPLGFIFCVEIGYRLAFSLMKRLSNDVFFAAGYLYLLVNLLRIELEWSLLFLYIRASLIGLIMIFMLSGPARIRGKSVAHHRTGVEVAYR
jgi:hypothetical protein